MKNAKFILIAAIISIGFISCASNTRERKNDEMISDKDVVYTFEVKGACGMCKERIENAALSVDGVVKAEWNKKAQTLKVKAPKILDDEIQRIIAAAGHDTETYTAPDDVYNTLPDCCKYREINKAK